MSTMESRIPFPFGSALGRTLVTVLRTSFFWQFVTLLSLGAASRRWLAAQENPETVLERWGSLAPLVAVALQTVTAATPFGTSVIPLANGAIFPLALAVACNLVGGVLGSTVMYLVWRRGDRELRIARALEGLPRWARRFACGDLASLVTLRVLPWAGGNLANLLAGTRGVPLRVHVLAATLGSVPGSLLYALLGAGVVVP